MDRVSLYALAVLAGTVPAGPHVRDACARHERDRATAEARGLRWDAGLANRAIDFFPDVLRLAGGEHEGKPFELHDWQAFVVGSLFGWQKGEYRRFRIGYIEAGKGAGKSPLGAGLAIYMTIADNEPRSEAYMAAVDKEQATIPFRDAIAMIKLSDELAAEFSLSGGEGKEWHAAHLGSGSLIKPISSESTGKGKSGYRPHFVLLDEVHEHPTNAMVEFMTKGTKGRRQPLIVMITNSGVNRQSVCFEYHTYGASVAAGTITDDSFFSYICAVDEKDNPFTDDPDPVLGYPLSWAKANPSIGVTFQPSYLEGEIARARGMPSSESLARRLNFCQWVDATNPWIDGDLWRACEKEPGEFPADDELKERPCFLSLDLGSKRDLAAKARTWPDDNGGFDAAVEFWTPGDTLEERERSDRVPYRAWVTGEHLNAVAGRSLDFAYIAKSVSEDVARFNVVGLAFDQWRIEDFQRELDDVGIESWIAEWDAKDERWVERDKKQPGEGLMLIRHGQGFGGGANQSTLWMPRSIGVTEDAIMQGKLRVLFNPVLRWNSASAVLESDATGNKKWEKRKSTGRIDGIVALSMAIGAATNVPAPEESVYATEGIFSP